jgi:hypothetical protein
MKKLLLLTIFYGALCIAATAQDNVHFTADMPAQIAAGETFVVRLSVDKPNVEGKFTIILSFPERFMVDEIPDDTTDFEWDGIQAYFKWDNDPGANVDVACSVTPPDKDNYDISIDGVFIYFMNGERQKEYFKLPIVKVGNGNANNDKFDDEPPVVAKPPVNIVEFNEPQKVDVVPPTDNVDTSSPVEYTENVYVLRQVPYREGGRYIVRLQINKGYFDGYGCLAERVTGGGHINMRESKGAKVDIYEPENEIHFTWDDMPLRDSITVMYEVDVLNNADIKINGLFYFGESGADDSVAVEERNILISKDLPISDEMPADISLNIIGSSKAVDDSKYKDGKIKRNQIERGLMYKIQVLAWRKELTIKEVRERLKKKHIEVREEITEDYIKDGSEFPYKYVVGHFRSYEQASQLRDYLQRNFGNDETGRPKAFLVCYYNGNRISVQEALLIQNRQR